MFKMLKVFDCQSMPDDVQKDFFDSYEKGNDVYVLFYNEFDPDIQDQLFVKWLYENGMTKEDEEVLINHWW